MPTFGKVYFRDWDGYSPQGYMDNTAGILKAVHHYK